MTTTMVFGVEYVLVSCNSDVGGAQTCGQSFAMSRRFYDQTHRTGETWYCPSGHPRVWSGKTTEQKLADAQSRETALQDQLRAAIEDAEHARSLHARDRARIAKGMCPCCRRYFGNVHRHITTQHPEYAAPEVKNHEPFQCGCGRTFGTYQGLRIHQGWARRDDWSKPGNSSWSSHLTVGANR